MLDNSIYLIEKNNIVKLGTDQMTVEKIGGKAFGLRQIPNAWSVPFFVISKELFEEYVWGKDKTIINRYVDNIKLTIERLGIKNHIILRSSAVNEGMKERGKFDSVETDVDNLANALVELLNKLENIPNNGMPIIVQEFISPVFTGHMSNERRFSRESRDWKVERYYQNGKFEQDTIGIRTWRTRHDIDEITNNILTTDSKNIITELQKVAFYWYELSKDKKCRFHLEFVFDGRTIYIVQADCDFPKDDSISPKSYDIKVKQLSGVWTPKILKKYDPCKDSKYKKLQNVKDYHELGFCTVPFYYLDDINTIINLQKGIVNTELKEDIETLLRIQSLVIRMDIICEDSSKKQMLPRSNEIHNYDDVISWLKRNANIISNGQEGIFIFHNFVPATASAFVHVMPNGRLVKIQSLWGLPEGLYYNYHDTIIVDLGSKKLDSITESDVKVTIKYKYKDLFICPNKDGRWIAYSIKEPYDWRCSIESNESIFEMATKSQKLANKLQEEISVMWFVGIDGDFYGANNLPWFHERVNLSSYTTDEYKRKYFREEEVVINNTEKLRELISFGNVKNVKCLRLKPNCEKDLRNKELIADIGKLAAENDIMILLDGTQLTHSYYQLKTTGAKVVCSDKDELLYSDTLEFNKLVRDKIPEKIISNGEHVNCSIVVRPLLDRMLLEKLLEEAYEVNDAKSIDDIISELADLTELCNTLLKLNKEYPISCTDILKNRRGEFQREVDKLVIFNFPVILPISTKTFKFNDLYGSISIQRKKTLYTVELNLLNYPASYKKEKGSKNDIQIQKIKSIIVTEASLALNSKKTKYLIKRIHRINAYVNYLCETMGVLIEQVEQKRELKTLKVGGFEKGYMLNQTTLKDNIINENVEFNPVNCNNIYKVEREYNKYLELLQDFEKGQKRLLIRFSLPIAVNEWEIVFNSPKIEEILINYQNIQFDVHKNSCGRLVLTVNASALKKYKQLSLFDF